MTSLTDRTVGERVQTPDGPGVIKNFVTVGGKPSGVLVELDSDRASRGSWPESLWRSYALHVLEEVTS